jgi:serine/threonine-protein kinase RsbW
MYRLTLASRLEELPRANDFLEGLASRGELSPLEALNLQLILEEILVNVVSHGQPAPGASIEIALGLGAEELELEIQDSGAAFNPLTAPAPEITASLEDRPIGGLGVHLVKRLSDRLEYQRLGGRNRLWLARRRES